MLELHEDDGLAMRAIQAIRNGDVEALRQLLTEHPDLAAARITSRSGPRSTRTLLHVVTDWPGHVPRGAETIALLAAHGADVNARFEGPHAETPLHWAASSNDVPVLDALLDQGADLEASGAVIGGGAPLADAVAFGQWNAAHRLVERGAQTTLWQAAALGLMDRVEAHFAGSRLPEWPLRGARPGDSAPDESTHSFWCACHGGQQKTAEFLLSRGADINWLGYDDLTPLGAARRAGANSLVEWLSQHGAN